MTVQPDVRVIDFGQDQDIELTEKLNIVRTTLAGTTPRRYRDKVEKKTVGIMRVRFTGEDQPVYIAAISGVGVSNTWTNDPTRFRALNARNMRANLPRDILWAEMTNVHPGYRQMSGERISPDLRKQFAAELKERLKRKIDNLRRINPCEETVMECLKRADEYYGDENLVRKFSLPFYMACLKSDELRDTLFARVESIIVEDNEITRAKSIENAKKINPYVYRGLWYLFNHTTLQPRDPKAPKIVAQFFLNPYIHSCFHGTFYIAFDMDDIGKRTLANITAQCCEDNALNKLRLVRLEKALQLNFPRVCRQIQNLQASNRGHDLSKRVISILEREDVPQKLYPAFLERFGFGRDQEETNANSAVSDLFPRVSSIDWTCATVGPLGQAQHNMQNKPPCGFCAVAFVPRAKQINNM